MLNVGNDRPVTGVASDGCTVALIVTIPVAHTDTSLMVRPATIQPKANTLHISKTRQSVLKRCNCIGIVAIGIDNRLWRLFNGAVIEPCVNLNGFNVKLSVYCLALY